MKINMCSETILYNIIGDGVHTSYMDCIELLKDCKDLEVVINNEGLGDIMHSHTYGPYYFWRGLKYRGKKILTVHVIPDSIKGTLPAWKLLMPFAKWYLKQVYSYADVCIAISPEVENTIKSMGVKTKIISLCNPILSSKWKRTPELRKKGRNILGLKENEFCVIGVGVLENRKGCMDFIEIGKQVPTIQFRWVGGRPWGLMTDGKRKLDRKIANASGNCKFAGMYSLSDMPSLYAAGDVFIFPSYQENSPLAPIEAAASGMPVIFRDIQEYKLLYTNQYLKAKNNKEFVDWILKLHSVKEEYEKAQAISIGLTLQFDKNEIRTQLLEIYKTLYANNIALAGNFSLQNNLSFQNNLDCT
jgi:1,2-diacylglycerol-3-alpha-glucose alpha-1,2-galactosyltransferase